jgi:integrase
VNERKWHKIERGIFRRAGSRWLWIRFYHRGKEYRESTKTDSLVLARKRLKQCHGKVGRGKFLGAVEEKVKFENLCELIRTDYRLNERRSVPRLEGSLKHLGAAFGLDRAIDIGTDRIERYKLDRKNDGAATATINLELAALKRAFTLAVEAEALSRAPHIEMLDVDNTREGFLEHADWLALRAVLPEDLRDPVSFLYFSGWRDGEMKHLEWRNVDFEGRVIRLPSTKSKNKKGRLLPLSGELAEIIERAHINRRLDCPFVFHRDGRQIKDYRIAWNTARHKVGLNRLLVHDLRRTAVRDLLRGRPRGGEKAVMAVTGHKTRAVFDRYNIIAEEDIADTIARRDEYLRTRPTERKVAKLEK